MFVARKVWKAARPASGKWVPRPTAAESAQRRGPLLLKLDFAMRGGLAQSP